jgi:hypothetical protein
MNYVLFVMAWLKGTFKPFDLLYEIDKSGYSAADSGEKEGKNII